MRRKIKNLTKAQAEKYFCDKNDDCFTCKLSTRTGCKMDPFNKKYDEEYVELKEE